MKSRLSKLASNRIVRSVTVLVSGTAIGHIVTLVALPILTRLYTPDDFAILALITSVISMISVAACMRLELAVPLPERDRDGINLLTTALLSSVLVSLFLLLLVALFSKSLAVLIGREQAAPYFLLIPFGVWLTSTSLALQYWLSRKKRFSVISTTRITRSMSGSGVQIGLGIWGLAPLGLILGQIMIGGAGVIRQFANILSNDRRLMGSISPDKMRKVAKEYRKFSFYSVLAALSNSAGAQLPVILIAALVVGPEAGFLLLATRLMTSPISLIGGAVSQVYISHAPEELRKGELGRFTEKVLSGLLVSMVGPLIFLGMVSPYFFGVVFGSDWSRAGEIVAWITPWITMRLLSTPIATALQVARREEVSLLLQAVGLISRVGVVLAASFWWPYIVVESYAVASFAFYALYFVVLTKVSEVDYKRLFNVSRKGQLIVLGWLAVAVMSQAVVANFIIKSASL